MTQRMTIMKKFLMMGVAIVIPTSPIAVSAQEQSWELIRVMPDGETICLTRTSETGMYELSIINNDDTTTQQVPSVVNHYSLFAISDTGMRELWHVRAGGPTALLHMGLGEIKVYDAIIVDELVYVIYVAGRQLVNIAIVHIEDDSAPEVIGLFRQSDVTGDYVSEASFIEPVYKKNLLFSIICINGVKRLWNIEGDAVQLIDPMEEEGCSQIKSNSKILIK